MHASISINSLSVNAGSLAGNAEVVARLGAAAISPHVEEVSELGASRADRLLRDAGLKAATLTHRAFGYGARQEAARQRDRLNQSIDLAAEIGAQSITMTTGGRGALTWREAMERFAMEIAPCADHARAAGIALAIEPTSHLYADVSIAHRLSDLVTICTRSGVGLGIDLFACWFDSDIEEAIIAAAPLCQLVQVSDYVAGDRGLPCRAVPGDGIAQVGRLVTLIRQAGFEGYFDIEIIGPRIESEGPRMALARASQRLGEWLSGPKPA